MTKAKIMKDDTKKTKSGLLKSMSLLRELFDEQRLALLYLKFDVECLHREKKFLQKEIDELRGE